MRNCLVYALMLAFGVVQAMAESTPMIVKNGQPNAQIVIAAENRPRMATLAALELQYYLEKISGARLPIATEPAQAFPVKVYVGKSKHTDALDVSGEDLKYGAFRIVSGVNHLVLLGGDIDFVPPKPWPKERKDTGRALKEWDKRVGNRTDSAWGYPFGSGFKAHWNRETAEMTKRYGKENDKLWPGGFRTGFWVSDVGGSLNAVYEFLRMHGVRWYMPGQIGEIVPAKASIALPKIDKTVRPDFAVRSYTWYNYSGFPFEHIIWARRTGMNSPQEVLGSMGYAHGLCQVHAREEMQQKHPEYYALRLGKRVTDYRGRGHVCFSSEGFFNETLNYARFMFDEFDQPHISLWPMDGFQHCQCESCKKLSSSDLVWGFVDRVARELYKTHPDRLVSCGAYTPYIHAPENVETFTPNVAVFIANAGRPYFDDPARWNAYWERVQGWREKLAPGNIMRVENNRYGLWSGGYPVIHPCNMAKDLRALKGISRGECCEESQSGMRWHAPGKDHLHLYVQARFLWDADQNLEALLEEYYTLFYGPAREEMKKALEFAEANYSRTDRSRSGGRTNPGNVPLKLRVRLGELLKTARDKAGDTIYGKRIQVLIDELPSLDTLRRELEEKAQVGDPRAEAPIVVARRVDRKQDTKAYRLRERVWKGSKAEQNTTFTVAWEKKAIIFDVRCHEPDMKSIRTSEKVWEGDSVMILLEPPGHSYYHIEIGADGRVFDADRAGGGQVTPRWNSMVETKTERGKDYWRVVARIPIAIVGKEGAEGDPFNYVVGPEPAPGTQWFFNIARRRPRPGHSRPLTYSFAPAIAYSLYTPAGFAKLCFE